MASVLACCSPATAATPLRYANRFTTRTPGAPTGLVSQIVYATNDNGHPKPVAAERVELPDGSRFGESVVPVCTTSDAELYATGTGACPDSSQVGDGSGAVDSGLGPPFDPLRGDISIFHAPHQLVFAGSPPGTHQVATISRFDIHGSTLEITNIPVTPGPPPNNEIVGQEVDTTLTQRTEGRRSFLTTPPTCPGGTWTSRLLVTYRDGGKETATATMPCAPGTGTTTTSHGHEPTARTPTGCKARRTAKRHRRSRKRRTCTKRTKRHHRKRRHTR